MTASASFRLRLASRHCSRASIVYYPFQLTLPAMLLMSDPAIDSSGPTNRRVVVDATNGKEEVALVFVEEPLGMPANEGYGWPQLEFGEAVGPDNRYIVCRKLGWGMCSSTWLARDQSDNAYVALKILNGNSTERYRKGHLWEREALERVSSPPSSQHCLRLLSHFTFTGKGSAGEHLCLVTPVLGGDVKELLHKCGLYEGKRHFFPLPLAKHVLKHVLRGIAHAHSRGVVHTDLKLDNFFFDCPMSRTDLEDLLKADSSRRHPPEDSFDGVVQAAVSQPLPLPTLEEAMEKTFLVGDFGSAQSRVDHITNSICPMVFRPPEIILGGPWDEKVDIWMFGCLVFELVVGCHLFRCQPSPSLNLDEPSNMLYQMLCYTCDDMYAAQLTASRLAPLYFNSDCELKTKPEIRLIPFQFSIRPYKVLKEEDVIATADLMHRCMRIDPADRESAADLLSDPWFDGVE
ncbi:kinase-like domain-containing protein [Amylostereum chailletii]|nr:kinase-like domain-containing protein [Amylostereum chailletii]